MPFLQIARNTSDFADLFVPSKSFQIPSTNFSFAHFKEKNSNLAMKKKCCFIFEDKNCHIIAIEVVTIFILTYLKLSYQYYRPDFAFRNCSSQGWLQENGLADRWHQYCSPHNYHHIIITIIITTIIITTMIITTQSRADWKLISTTRIHQLPALLRQVRMILT